MTKKILLIFLLLCLQVIGCVSIQPEQLSRVIEKEELSEHVHFLAQPALKGRKPKTWESATVRRYLKSRFETYGLVPWGQTKGYEQSFGYGTNVIGILPGSDPNLADEIVILAAHYDHLGKGKKGIYHGASDNASGVAVLLEIAEQLSLSEQKLKRSVCFAAFDCEERMLLGSFAFTCREDFDKANIVAAVNVDTLGRDFFDVVENKVVVVGTIKYRKLRQQIIQAGVASGIDVVVLGADIVGPRSDHVPFESMAIPCLFFTCGYHGDYHMPSDAADKLNYGKITRSANVILATVRHLANAESIEQPITPKSGDIEELEAFKLSIAEISNNYAKAGLTQEQGKQIAELADEADMLLRQDEYSRQDRRRFIWKAGTIFGPLVTDPAAPKTPADSNEARIVNKYGMAVWGAFYATHRVALVEGARKFVKHLVKHKPGLFRGMPKFKHEVYELADEDIYLGPQGDGQYLLSVLPGKMKIEGEVAGWFFKHGGISISVSFRAVNCEGTTEQIIDFCLLQWGSNLENEAYVRAWQQVLEKVAQTKQVQTYDEWMQWRLEQGDWANEKEWVLNLMRSDSPDLASAAISSSQRIAGRAAQKVNCQIIRDGNIRSDVRARAISILTKGAGPEAMLTLVDVLNDETPCYREEYDHCMDKSYPFYNHPGIQMRRAWAKWFEKKGKSKAPETSIIERAGECIILKNEMPMTLGDKALLKLTKLTKRDFGKDKQAWREWVEANTK